ncbi:MAG: hypothetical protein EOS58_11090 [Mesorhizobium sp.]|uniref:hypothetical protein n=1 Tax=unclassified Mesorhizobium TaxID=325217 RepID=UPI000F751148|nr:MULTISPECIES: hypothetical protein [unclassified Mesorhizobium]AZO49319.1 hypothetical protein EJ073_17050 [Mesorhizobium sp. M4B.F.Ca.ET.058.02.1.1]RUX52918.1 hypothetical protein EOA33_01025 [Mesorhizobium sp. M4A.F.Ca.ET.050.02.1.1]RVC45338.1 hypothetical protein EN781_10315 [Mesorhizobium sp. M4A.F.Ca.ET.090.04.2.1]RVC83297.1 hypothetical protein EN745_03410 [Mesorhizobium sp. M4A.F.Ca.ET.022.05.2.1]RVD44087.1 hypothetical protein EN742_03355 [Mesorhizobium sp. M4A.F.Ca.ET.020.02.1.1]
MALDYDKARHLDAENLAEQGMATTYQEVLPELRQYVKNPTAIEESVDTHTTRYAVRAAGQEYVLYAPDVPESEGRSWGTATYVFFKIINDQLAGSDVRFYALNGGNDLFGIFLTPQQAEDAKRSLPTRTDWPYLPDAEWPWYGQYH